MHMKGDLKHNELSKNQCYLFLSYVNLVIIDYLFDGSLLKIYQ